MSTSPCSLKGAGCTLVCCLCGVHLVVALVYTLNTGESLAFVFSSQTVWAKAASFLSNRAVEVTVTPMGNTLNHTAEPESTTKEPTPVLELCPENPPRLVGPLHVQFSDPVSVELVQEENPEVQEGGRWRPRNCTARQKVAIIIPFRHRESHLKYWLYYLHPILQKQQLDYGIYVINQHGETTFNRAKLMNVGFAEALKQYDYDCFVFSDVDIVPMDDRNFYKCYSQPRHLSVALDKFNFVLPYSQIFGGVTALTKKQYTTINGFPNNYWGWGGEDDDIFTRVQIKGLSISRPDNVIGRCRMIRHGKDSQNDPNPKRFEYIQQTARTMATDGINSLNYSVLSVDKYQLYTNITVDIGQP